MVQITREEPGFEVDVDELPEGDNGSPDTLEDEPSVDQTGSTSSRPDKGNG